MTKAPADMRIEPLAAARFGCRVVFASDDIGRIVETCRRESARMLDAFYAARGLMVIAGLEGIRRQPRALVELSELFGEEVENYRETLTSARFFHDSVEQILVLSNAPPCNHPPPPRAVGDDGRLLLQFPAQANWHTDQSYRRPPPDVTLLLALELPPPGQGQTLFADCIAAFETLGPCMRARLEELEAIHAPSWIGRSRAAVENGEPVLDLLPHQRPQRQPILRRHPVSGQTSLYLCEEKQLDYVDGPVVGLSTGPAGEGAELIRRLLAHATQPDHTYAHCWHRGDLVIADNRNLLHCATWYDAERYTRLMWRTTVMGNPGGEYAGEEKSWIPADGSPIMAGMEHA
ncbi:MAG: TauD/TfdA family dioxygenase [Gammaproteobacteria bacterium]|nr:TauD/TfdA family dioxygenase [Gammaproteobacteria bacterium]